MSKTQITIERVDEVENHPHADRLDIIQVLGYKVVVGRDQFKVGDAAIYFPPDILIPESVSDDLGVTKYLKHAVYPGDEKKTQCRVAACRLRGVPSHGFVFGPVTHEGAIGVDLTLQYRGFKYEPPKRQNAGDAETEDPRFYKYTSIENIQRYPNILQPLEEVVVTEKIHGCVTAGTKIRMVGGSNKRITDIKPGDFVLGVNKQGQCVPSEVLHSVCNGKADKWLRVQTTFKKAGRGNSFRQVLVTPNHKFFCPETGEYTAIEKLAVNDTVMCRRTDPGLGEVVSQVLLGKLLGDGYLQQSKCSGAVQFGHADKCLTDWTLQACGKIAAKRRDEHLSGYGSKIYRGSTIGLPDIKDKFGDFYQDKKKVPAWVADEINPLALAFWYMDDGSLGSHSNQEDRAHFAVCGFTREDCEVLQKGLRRFNIDSVYYVSDVHSRLRLNADDAEKLFILIAPYIPFSLQYKLPERFQGHEGWLPTTDYKPELVPQKIISIEESGVQSKKYDLETSTHNYFASDILVHNSNCRMGKIDGEYMAGSHTVRRKSGTGLYWQFIDLVKPLLDSVDGNVIVYGEIFGPGVQDLDYGLSVRGFRAFDIMVDGAYVDFDMFIELCEKHGVDTVPVLYRGPYHRELVEEFTYGRTTFDGVKAKFKDREGCVIKPVVERVNWDVGRVILKSVSADYRNRKGGKDIE